jgi:hypothetical protein
LTSSSTPSLSGEKGLGLTVIAALGGETSRRNGAVLASGRLPLAYCTVSFAL